MDALEVSAGTERQGQVPGRRGQPVALMVGLGLAVVGVCALSFVGPRMATAMSPPTQAPTEAPTQAPTEVPTTASPTELPTTSTPTTPAPTTSAPTLAPTASSDCLCVFDIDRTLTARQDTQTSECSGTETSNPCIFDSAYGIRPSCLRASGITSGYASTRCAKNCYFGIVSHGVGTDDKERQWLLDRTANLGVKKVKQFTASEVFMYYADRETKKAPCVLLWPEGTKHHAIRDLVLPWYAEQGVIIEPSNVYFFDDIQTNVDGISGDRVADLGYHATLVSKASRSPSGHRGRCGGTTAEVDGLVPEGGVWPGGTDIQLA